MKNIDGFLVSQSACAIIEALAHLQAGTLSKDMAITLMIKYGIGYNDVLTTIQNGE